MDEIKIGDIVQSLKNMQNENARLRATAQNYKVHADKLRTIAEQLSNIAKDLDPYITTRATTNIDYATIVNEVFDKIKSGAQVDSKFIATTYGYQEEGTVSYIMAKLKALPGIKVRKEGRRAFLYI